MNLNEIKKAVAKIKTSVFKNSNSYSIGMLKSHFRGTGLQFKEHRVYAVGDDTRFIDWKILAKTGHPYIKTFDEERNVEIVVVVDASVTMLTGYNRVSKLQAALEICCLLYLLAEETGDYVHVVIIGDSTTNVPKKNGDCGIANLVASLEKMNLLKSNGQINVEYEPGNIISNTEKLRAIMKHLKKRRELVFLSDFNDFLEIEALRRISYRKNVHCFQITSPLDEATSLPYMLHTTSGGMRSVNFTSKEKNLETVLGKKVKTLKVHERYLEDFIKEML